MYRKTLAVVWVITLALTSIFAGGSSESVAPATAAKTLEGDYVLPEYIEFQRDNSGYLPAEKDGVSYNFFKKELGFGIVMPYIEWNGGTTYKEQLNLRIAGGDSPDVFMVVQGMENQLIKDGALLDLTDYLEKYAPNCWNLVDPEIWKIVRNNDPTGQGRIWYVPSIFSYQRHGAMVRQDWLDKLNIKMPATQDEFVEMLKAFKTRDPNGNGKADEIPTGGRADVRWFDYLFYMYGISMFEGIPGWDIYDGQLTYSAVTKNMRDALQWISTLYKQGLIDPETLLNSKGTWESKIAAGNVGVYYHLPQTTYQRADNIYSATGVKAKWVTLPAIDANGYDGQGFYQAMLSGEPQFVVKNTNDLGRIVASLKAIDANYQIDKAEYYKLGPEGMYHVLDKNGSKVMLPLDKNKQERLAINVYDVVANEDLVLNMLDAIKTPEGAWSIEDSKQCVRDVQQYGRVVAGNNIPNSIFEDYEDIQARTLYVEYASKIIIGEWPIEKFDEFVKKWYSTGGTEVTKKARAWYSSVSN
ncbi:MAG: extracellular solute-binding protein [Bacilli bacterium]|nr:extracellular solute-binding protein [Bacilli bacterium]